MTRYLWTGILALAAVSLLAQTKKNPAGDMTSWGDFFIVSSVDIAKNGILLKLPSEVTELMRVDERTKYFEEGGRAIRLNDLRAGDTVYITSRPGSDRPIAVAIHKGPMTMEVLRARYLTSK